MRRAAGFRISAWEQNCLRHSFCSHHLDACGDAARTAFLAGHSPAMLYRHYRGIVGPAAGRAFFELRPEPALVAEGVRCWASRAARANELRRQAARRQWAARRAAGSVPVPRLPTPTLADLGGAAILPVPCQPAPST